MKNKFCWRAFISFGLIYSFIIIFLSGIILYMSPPGRYAHWVNWKILDFTKEGWQALHTVFSEDEPPIPHAELLTLVELAKQLKLSSVEEGLSADEVIKTLHQNGIMAEKGQTLREIRDYNNISPREIFDLFSK